METNPLIAKLAQVRSRIRLLLVGNSLCLFLVSACLVIAASFLLDWLFHLPWGARAIVLLAMIVVMVRGAYLSLIRPFSLRLSDDAVALHVQSKNPDFDDGLISAIQLARELEDGATSESKSMIAATVAQANERYLPLDFRNSVTARPLLRPAMLALLLALSVLSYGVALPQHAQLWFNRCLLLGDEIWPADTVLDVRIVNLDQYRYEIDKEGDYEVWVPEGSILIIEAQAKGIVPNAVKLHKYAYPRIDEDRAITIEIARRLDSDIFEHRFGRVRESFEFYLEGGDDNDEHPYFTVHVRTAPKVEELLVNYDYPTYINAVGKEDRKDVREYNIVGPKGTNIEMYFRTSNEVSRFEIIIDEDLEHPLVLQSTDEGGRVFLWKYLLEADHFYTYQLIGANGTPSTSAPNFNISAQPDVAPDIAIERPDTSTVDVTPTALLPLKFRVVDDYKVGEIAMNWDGSRGGLFAGSKRFADDEKRKESDQREVSIFSPIEVDQFKITREGSLSPLQVGDRLFLKLTATDTRSTTLDSEPNSTVYPSLIVLNIREAAEIQRDLTRSQIRIKGQLTRIEESLATKQDELELLVANYKSLDQRKIEDGIQGFISSHALLTSGLNESCRGFLRIFDGYLFNRIDNSNLTAALISEICGLHRQQEGSHMEFVAEVLPKQRALINDSEPMGKLALLMDLLLQTAKEQTSALNVSLRAGFDEADKDKRWEYLKASKLLQQELLERIRVILDKMADWEDFQDVIQSLKDIIELEKGLQNRIKKIAK